jgi:hypothetical protein
VSVTKPVKILPMSDGQDVPSRRHRPLEGNRHASRPPGLLKSGQFVRPFGLPEPDGLLLAAVRPSSGSLCTKAIDLSERLNDGADGCPLLQFLVPNRHSHGNPETFSR